MIKIFYLIYIVFFAGSVSLKAQVIGKGVYRGQKLPFEICFLTCNDTTIEVECFSKGEQILGHTPPKKLVKTLDSFSSKPILKSVDDSLMVFIKSDYYLIKRKGFEKIKVYKINEKEVDIITLRNRNLLFSFSHNLNNELKTHVGFDEQKFWNQINSYELLKFITLNPIEFNKKLEEVGIEIKNKWL